MALGKVCFLLLHQLKSRNFLFIYLYLFHKHPKRPYPQYLVTIERAVYSHILKRFSVFNCPDHLVAISFIRLVIQSVHPIRDFCVRRGIILRRVGFDINYRRIADNIKAFYGNNVVLDTDDFYC